MDKSWMTIGKTPDARLSHSYIEGVNAFINFTRAVVDLSGNIPCSCIHCVNFYRQSPYTVRIHLLHRGIIQSYINWYNHGEARVLNENIHDNGMSDGDHMDGIDALVGVNAFINFTRAVVDLSGNIPCSCIHCVNCYRQSPYTVRIHLLHRGIIQSYINWYNHGEARVLNENIHDNGMSDGDHMDGIDALVGDQIRGEPRNATEDEEVCNFDKLEEDAKRELYPGCTDYNILKSVIEMLNVKVMTNLSNKGLDMMLELLTKVLPKGNLVPRSTYEVKKILHDLGMSYEHIDACKNDCALFWKENKNLDKCQVCEAPRYKDTRAQGKKIPHKVLRYFPLTPRLRRLYMLGQRAKNMKWYIDKRVDDGIMRHPVIVRSGRSLICNILILPSNLTI
ncbi:hypothetical protein SO802_025781 [Lithocarpus litseifolius]|uniref:Transposase-associated domain-containing protein n=1 Tax=Lithocarpus litseifolius TaxID=425828 RepID=A0AAW2BXS4_9ROSI